MLPGHTQNYFMEVRDVISADYIREDPGNVV